MRVIAYTRRSTRKQAQSRAVQLRAIRRECDARGWTLVGVETDTASGKSRRRRPGLAAAVEACRSDRADALGVARLDRLVRSVADFGALIEEARDQGFTIVVLLDHNIDTSTANGRLVANVLASVAAWEREIIGERTAEGLAEKQATTGWPAGGDRRTREADRAEACRLWRDGRTQREIAEALGWRRNKVARILRQEHGLRHGQRGRIPRC
jgi:DNA invertase Pin-like site-specific DNA recombinase